jgi:hypothetical protein
MAIKQLLMETVSGKHFPTKILLLVSFKQILYDIDSFMVVGFRMLSNKFLCQTDRKLSGSV